MDKARRKALQRQYRLDEHAQARRELGLSEPELRSLLDSLDTVMGTDGCDNTPRATRAWLLAHNLDVEAVTEALGQLGGGCDCEVLANVTPDKFGWPD